MYINFDIDIDRTKIPNYLKETMDELDTLYNENKDSDFAIKLSSIITFTESAEANHKINIKTSDKIRQRYGILW